MSNRRHCEPYIRCNVHTKDLFDLAPGKNHSFCGHRMAQTWSTLFMLENVFLSNPDITRIVELGTGCGGLTIFFGLQMTTRLGEVLTFDIRKRMKPSWHALAKTLNITYEQKDVLESGTLFRTKNFMKNERTLIFCDADRYIKGLLPYVSVLKKNDLVMVHDWGTEVTQKDVNAITNLEPYRQHEFDDLKTYILSMRKV